jgi:hypothetical protein
MNTPMETNLKLLVDSSSELIYATLYKQIIGSLMYLTNTRPDICFAVNTFEFNAAVRAILLEDGIRP